MLQDIIETDASPSAWAGAMQMDPRPLNWSAYDWLVLWISSPLSPSSVTFNVTAVIRSSPHGTLAEPLNFGWQERTVDLRQLGADRSEITQVTLRFNAPSISRERFYLDDMRLIASKRVDETAEIRQIIDKANATSTTVRNAVIAYDWVIANASGIGGIESLREARELVRCHHERYDGGGYPEGLRGDKIRLGARLVAVGERAHIFLSDDEGKT